MLIEKRPLPLGRRSGLIVAGQRWVRYGAALRFRRLEAPGSAARALGTFRLERVAVARQALRFRTSVGPARPSGPDQPRPPSPWRGRYVRSGATWLRLATWRARPGGPVAVGRPRFGPRRTPWSGSPLSCMSTASCRQYQPGAGSAAGSSRPPSQWGHAGGFGYAAGVLDPPDPRLAQRGGGGEHRDRRSGGERGRARRRGRAGSRPRRPGPRCWPQVRRVGTRNPAREASGQVEHGLWRGRRVGGLELLGKLGQRAVQFDVIRGRPGAPMADRAGADRPSGPPARFQGARQRPGIVTGAMG